MTVYRSTYGQNGLQERFQNALLPRLLGISRKRSYTLQHLVLVSRKFRDPEALVLGTVGYGLRGESSHLRIAADAYTYEQVSTRYI